MVSGYAEFTPMTQRFSIKTSYWAQVYPDRCHVFDHDRIYVSGYYSTKAICQISEQEKHSVEFRQRPFHVFASINISTFKYTFGSSMVPRKLHSPFLLIFGTDDLFHFGDQPTVY